MLKVKIIHLSLLRCFFVDSLCLTEFGILLVAVSCPQAHGAKFRVNPGNSLVIRQGHVGFFIAQGPNEVRRQVNDYDDDNHDNCELSSLFCSSSSSSSSSSSYYYYRQDLPEGQLCRHCFYSRADFRIFRPAGATRCTDQGEIWHGERTIGPLIRAKFHLDRSRGGVYGPQN